MIDSAKVELQLKKEVNEMVIEEINQFLQLELKNQLLMTIFDPIFDSEEPELEIPNFEIIVNDTVLIQFENLKNQREKPFQSGIEFIKFMKCIFSGKNIAKCLAIKGSSIEITVQEILDEDIEVVSSFSNK